MCCGSSSSSLAASFHVDDFRPAGSGVAHVGHAGPGPGGPGWAYEFKGDGVRTVTAVAGGELRARSRNHKPLAAMYPELGELRDLVDQAVVLDGEVVALEACGFAGSPNGHR